MPKMKNSNVKKITQGKRMKNYSGFAISISSRYLSDHPVIFLFLYDTGIFQIRRHLFF